MDRHLISITIVNYNNRAELKRCLRSIYETKGALNVEVLVCDNNSSDGSAEMVEAFFPDVIVIRNPENYGLSRAANILLREVSGSHVLFLDSDTELKPSAIQDLFDFLSRSPSAGIAGPRIYNEDGSVQETTRRFPSVLSGLFGRRAFITKALPNNPISKRLMCLDSLNEKEPFEADYLSAACMMMKREVIRRIGPLDEGYFVYWTDVDCCRMAKDAGYKVFCVPSAKVIHYERYQPRKKKNPRMIIDFHRGAYRYYRKHNIKNNFSFLNLFAMSALATRTAIQLALNHFKH